MGARQEFTELLAFSVNAIPSIYILVSIFLNTNSYTHNEIQSTTGGLEDGDPVFRLLPNSFRLRVDSVIHLGVKVGRRSHCHLK